MNKIGNYFSLVKFSHTVFAMPFACIGFSMGVNDMRKHAPLLGRDYFAWKFLLVVICMVSARNAAMAFNRFLDKDFDALNPRTALREIPRGILSGRSVLVFTVLNALVFMASAFFINRLCFLLAPVALFVILFYSFTKRFTALCHLVLGLGLSLAPMGAYLAITGIFSVIPLLFSLSVIFWVAGFDIIYALQDEDFDKSQQLHSIPVLLGQTNGLRFSVFLHLLSALFIFIAGYLGDFGLFFWIGTAIFSSMLIYQHSLVKPGNLSKVNLAFMTTNGIASLFFGALVIIDIFF